MRLRWSPNLLSIWICVIGGFFVGFQFLLQGSISLMIEPLKYDFSLNAAQIGIIASAFLYPYLILQIPSGILIDRFGPKAVLLVASIILTITTFLFAATQGLWSATAIRIAMGIASAPGVTCAMYLAARWQPDRFALFAGLIEMLGMLGGAAGDYLIDWWTTAWGWRQAMLLCGMISIVISALILLFVRSHPRGKATNHHDHLASSHSVFKTIKAFFSSPVIWLAGIFSGLMFICINTFASLWGIPFLQSIYPTSPHFAAYGVALLFIGVGVGVLIFGELDRHVALPKLLRISSFVGLLLTGLIIYIPIGQPLMLIALFAMGLACGSYILIFSFVERVIDPQIKGIALGFINCWTMGIGGPLLQPLIGKLLVLTDQHFGWALLPMFIGLALALAIAVGLTRSLTRLQQMKSSRD